MRLGLKQDPRST